ncbi:MAG: hypothetical protein V2A73_09870, partial [Pseudomonadota bacterium]
MTIKKVLLFLAAVTAASVVGMGICLLYYHNPIYAAVGVGLRVSSPIIWNSSGEKLAFLEKIEQQVYLKVYDLPGRHSLDYPLGGSSEVCTADKMAFSPDSKRIAYFRRTGDTKRVAIINLEDKTSLQLEDRLADPDMSRAANDRPLETLSWLDNQRLLYESSVPFQRHGTLVVNLQTGRVDLYLEGAIR